MNFEIKNATSRGFLLKAIELLFAFIVLMIFQCGYKGDVLFWGEGPELPMPGMRNDYGKGKSFISTKIKVYEGRKYEKLPITGSRTDAKNHSLTQGAS